ncbi:MAG: ADP-ribosylglycohydrolase family protein, partial [Pseudomonadota bacterium]
EDMVGGGPFNLRAGEWTDDTSMALCLAESLLTQGTFDANDQMQRYCRWMDDGHLSSTGDCFDIGNTVANALERYRLTRDPFAGSTHARSAGNGSLMRLAPVALFYHPDRAQAVHYAAESSRTTHGAPEAVDACAIFAEMLCRALDGATKADVLAVDPPPQASERLASVCSGAYRGREAAQISGSGYVVDCLEAALWCYDQSDDFRSAVLLAANLGDDADTTDAVTGQIAGATYGVGAIPHEWLDKLALRAQLTAFADGLLDGPR